ncbi:hypothetical protein BDR03DRAFT_1039897 [Suillus americanus]|nr:hypothetical protein BDR03DRAFT_1039897 [Suillus americanus]
MYGTKSSNVGLRSVAVEAHMNIVTIANAKPKTHNADISDPSMDAKDTYVLRDIHQIIEVPHVAQELLSSERTPTLSMALPAYEYINEGGKTRIYALSIIVNQSIKLECLKEHWEAEDVENAREWMLQAMISICTSIRVGETGTQLELATSSVSHGTLPTLGATEERFRKELELDRKDAECEFSRYEDEISFVSGRIPDFSLAGLPVRISLNSFPNREVNEVQIVSTVRPVLRNMEGGYWSSFYSVCLRKAKQNMISLTAEEISLSMGTDSSNVLSKQLVREGSS